LIGREPSLTPSSSLRILVYHLPWPGLGHLVKGGDGLPFEPAPSFSRSRSGRVSTGVARITCENWYSTPRTLSEKAAHRLQ
jgi:hypothetical protein